MHTQLADDKIRTTAILLLHLGSESVYSFFYLDISLHRAPRDTFLFGCDHLFSCWLVSAHKHFVRGKFYSHL